MLALVESSGVGVCGTKVVRKTTVELAIKQTVLTVSSALIRSTRVTRLPLWLCIASTDGDRRSWRTRVCSETVSLIRACELHYLQELWPLGPSPALLGEWLRSDMVQLRTVRLVDGPKDAAKTV